MLGCCPGSLGLQDRTPVLGLSATISPGFPGIGAPWAEQGPQSVGPSAAPSVSRLGITNITPKQTLLLIAAAPGPSQSPQSPIFRSSEVSTVLRFMQWGVNTGTVRGPPTVPAPFCIPFHSSSLGPWDSGGLPPGYLSVPVCPGGRGKSSWLSSCLQSTYCVLSSVGRDTVGGTTWDWLSTWKSSNGHETQWVHAPSTHSSACPKAPWGRTCHYPM